MALLDINVMDYGLSTDPNFTATRTGPDRVIAGAMEDIEYWVSIPAVQVDGVSATSGTLTVTFTYKTSAGVTVDANAFPAQAVASSIYYRTALPMGADRVAVTLTISGGGNLGRLAAGFTLGGKRLNRAF